MLRRLLVVFTVFIGVSWGVSAQPVSISALVITSSAASSETETMVLSLESLGASVMRFDAANASEIRSAIKGYSEQAAESDVAIVYLDGAVLQSDGRDFFAPAGLVLRRKSDLLTQAIPLSAFVRATDLAMNGGAVMVHSSGQGIALIDQVNLVQTAPESRVGASVILMAQEGSNPLLISAFAQQVALQTRDLSDIMNGLAQRPGISLSHQAVGPILLREPAPVVVPTVVEPVTAAPVDPSTPDPVQPVSDTVDPATDQPVIGLNLPQIQPDPVADPDVQTDPDQPSESPTSEPETQTLAEPALTLEMLTALQNGLSQLEKRNIQSELKLLGFYNGPIDGLFGRGTARAIRAYQESIGAEPTGVLTIAQLEDLT